MIFLLAGAFQRDTAHVNMGMMAMMEARRAPNKNLMQYELVNCAVFRNESGILSSNLILEAERMAAIRWKNERLYTYVNASAIASANPGYCFKMAGWKACGVTSTKKLIILEKYQ